MAKKGKTLRHASALKAARQAKARQEQNYQIRSKVRTITSKFLKAVTNKRVEEAKAQFVVLQSAWQKAAKTGVFSKNAASRKISRMASRLSALPQS